MFVHKLKVTVAIAALMSASALFAHDAKLHAGDATEGQIVSIAGNNVVMKTAKGDVKVTLNKDTKLATGEIVAKEMIMPMASTKGAAKAEGDHKH